MGTELQCVGSNEEIDHPNNENNIGFITIQTAVTS